MVIITPNTERYQKLQKMDPEDISWMKEEHVIMREEGSGTRKEAENQLKDAGIKMTDLDIIASIENQGMGISVLSKLATKDEVAAGFLLAFPIPESDDGRDINLVYNKNYQLSRSAERFVKIVKEVYGLESHELKKEQGEKVV